MKEGKWALVKKGGGAYAVGTKKEGAGRIVRMTNETSWRSHFLSPSFRKRGEQIQDKYFCGTYAEF